MLSPVIGNFFQLAFNMLVLVALLLLVLGPILGLLMGGWILKVLVFTSWEFYRWLFPVSSPDVLEVAESSDAGDLKSEQRVEDQPDLVFSNEEESAGVSAKG